MNDIKLSIPTQADEAAVMKSRAAFLARADHIPGAGGLENYSVYEDWLAKVRKDSNGPIDKGRVKATQYLAYAGNDLVGFIQLRHELNDYLENYGGHIGYSVHPGQRRKGYATAMLRYCLYEAKALGITRVLITCDTDNVASEGVIRRVGGTYEDTRDDPSGAPKKRFWVANTSK